MKTNRIFLKGVALAGLVAAIGQMAFAGGRTSGGGAGVIEDGRFMSFYSAGFYTEPNPISDISEVEGLPELLNFVNASSFWTTQDKSALAAMAAPSAKHQYYRVKEEYFNYETKGRILGAFADATGVHPEEMRLFAITDTEAGITYLLPGFDNLSLADKVGALFHETYWLLYPNTDYKRIVEAEMAFRAVVDQPSNSARILKLLNYYGDFSSKVIAAINADIESVAMADLLNEDNSIDLGKIYGEDGMLCISSRSGVYTNTCNQVISNHLYNLKVQHPNSRFLALLYFAQSQVQHSVGPIHWEVWNGTGSDGGATLGQLGLTSSSGNGITPKMFKGCVLPLPRTNQIAASSVVRFYPKNCKRIEKYLRTQFEGTVEEGRTNFILDLKERVGYR